MRSGENPLLKNSSVKATLDCQPPVVRIDESFSPVSLDSVVIAERDTRSEKYPSASPINSVECLEADQVKFELYINCFSFFFFRFLLLLFGLRPEGFTNIMLLLRFGNVIYSRIIDMIED